MKLKHNYFVNIFFILAIVGIVIISGCIQSPETKEFANNLPHINENLRISLKNIHTDFDNYDLDYSVNRLMNMLTITDSIITGMEKEENNIKEDMLNTVEIISNYQTAKQSVKTNQLSEEEKNVMIQIDAKIEDYNSNNDKLNSCLSEMQTYREWITLVQENVILLENLDNQLILMNEYVQSEKYQEALAKVNVIQNTVSQLKQNAQERDATGIQDISTESIKSYELYSESFEYYKEFINLLIAEDYDSADLKYTIYSQKYSEAISISSDEEASITETINEVDNWYQSNIGVCFDLFTSYS